MTQPHRPSKGETCSCGYIFKGSQVGRHLTSERHRAGGLASKPYIKTRPRKRRSQVPADHIPTTSSLKFCPNCGHNIELFLLAMATAKIIDGEPHGK
jgi:hypothetical protein